MSLIDKQMFLKELAERLGAFVPANDIHKILAETDEALKTYDVISIPVDDADDSEELLKYFLDAKRVEGKSEKTVGHYKYVLKRLRKDTKVPFRQLTVYHIRGYFHSEQERGISARTIEGYRQTYSSFFGWLQRENLLPNNPMVNLTAIKHTKVVRKPFTAVELVQMNEAVKTTRDKALIAFMCSTGCRVSEVCSVNKSDVNFQSLQLKVLGKGNKERVVYIDEVTAMLLQRYISEREDSYKAMFVGKGTDRLTPSGVRTMLKKISQETGIENIHPHRFRRTLATSLINNGMPIQEVATILGHEKIDTTMTYVYIDERNIATAYRKYAGCR